MFILNFLNVIWVYPYMVRLITFIHMAILYGDGNCINLVIHPTHMNSEARVAISQESTTIFRHAYMLLRACM